MSIVFHTTGLKAGTYTDTFVITSNASNNPLRIPITFTISQSSEGQPSLNVSPNSPITNNSVPIGTQTNLTPTPISLSSSNSTQINFSVSTQTGNFIGPNWLTVNLNGGTSGSGSVSGTTPASLTVVANLQGFAPNATYTGTVTIAPTSSSSNGPQVIRVTISSIGVDSIKLDWNPTSSAAQTMPLTTSPTGRNGTVVVSSQTKSLFYYTAAADALSPPGGSWLQISPAGMQATPSSLRSRSIPRGSPTRVIRDESILSIPAIPSETSLLVTLDFSGATLIRIAIACGLRRSQFDDSKSDHQSDIQQSEKTLSTPTAKAISGSTPSASPLCVSSGPDCCRYRALAATNGQDSCLRRSCRISSTLQPDLSSQRTTK